MKMFHKHISVWVVVSVIITIITIGTCTTLHSYISSNEQVTSSNNHTKAYYDSQIRTLTPNTYTKQLAQNIPNVTNIKRTASHNFTHAIRLAYSNSQTNHKYNHNAKTIKSLTGKTVSNKMLSIVKPQLSQAFSYPRSASNNIKNISISFGDYDINNNYIPMNVIVTYQSPKALNASGNTKGAKKTTNTNTDIYSIDVNVKHNQSTYYLNYFESNV